MFPMLFHLHPQFCCSNSISTYPGMEASDCFAWVILDFCRPISKRTWLGVQKWGLGVSNSRRVDWIVYSYFATWFFGSWAEPFFRTILGPQTPKSPKERRKNAAGGAVCRVLLQAADASKTGRGQHCDDKFMPAWWMSTPVIPGRLIKKGGYSVSDHRYWFQGLLALPPRNNHKYFWIEYAINGEIANNKLEISTKRIKKQQSWRGNRRELDGFECVLIWWPWGFDNPLVFWVSSWMMHPKELKYRYLIPRNPM